MTARTQSTSPASGRTDFLAAGRGDAKRTPLSSAGNASASEVRGSFAFRALDSEGRESSGVVSAASAEEVARKLRSEGKTILAIGRDAAISSRGKSDVATRASGARRSDLAALCRHLGTMTEAGVPISEALATAANEGVRAEFRPFVEALATEVESGVPLSVAFARRGRDVPTIVVALTRAAESTGQLGPLLLRAAEHLRKSDRLAKQLRAAASYPFFMLGAGAVIVVALLAFVLPRFARIYADRGAELPWPTRFLLAASDGVRNHALELGLGAAVCGCAVYFFARSEAWAAFLDRVRFGLPVVGRLARIAFVAVSCRTLATLLASGIHLLDAIAICRGLSRSPRAERFWLAIDARLRDGGSFVEALREESLLPPTVVSMVAAGERTGRLPEVLARAADFAEEDLESALKQATSLLEPALILLFGSILGAVAIALLLPLFSVAKVVAG
ncbi:MAG: type II secretion system F family protein [Limnohabitans sp.]|jgi:type IV pilus assembly protein PilC|nr:type II secretion system F family protein [Limnohabitans sp.]